MHISMLLLLLLLVLLCTVAGKGRLTPCSGSACIP
jgi:hypothetical protein